MFTASNIVYHIDDENKVITATATGMKNDAIDTVLKAFRKENVIFGNTDVAVAITTNEDGTVKDEGIEVKEFPLCTCGRYLLPNKMTGQAKYDPDDPHEYDVERGKQIARRRLYDEYNKAYKYALTNLQYAINSAMNIHVRDTLDLTRGRLIRFEYFEMYDIFKNCGNSYIVIDSLPNNCDPGNSED